MKIFLVSLIVGLHHILNTYQGGLNQREILVLLQLHITLFSTWDICQCNNTSHVSCREGLSPFSAGPDVHISMFQLLTLNGLMSGHRYLDIWVSSLHIFISQRCKVAVVLSTVPTCCLYSPWLRSWLVILRHSIDQSLYSRPLFNVSNTRISFDRRHNPPGWWILYLRNNTCITDCTYFHKLLFLAHPTSTASRL